MISLMFFAVSGIACLNIPEASALCCKCSPTNAPSISVCLTGTADDCGQLATKSANLAGNVTCGSASLDEPGQGTCRLTKDGGVCSSAPTPAATYVPPPETGNVRGKKTQDAPKLNTPIPGLAFPAAIKTNPQSGVASFPYLAQYISALTTYLFVIVWAVAAVMVIYGGFLYILGSTMQSVSRGKEVIAEALIGLVIMLSARVILATVNPATVNLIPIQIATVTPDPLTADDLMPEILKGMTVEIKPVASTAARTLANLAAASAAAQPGDGTGPTIQPNAGEAPRGAPAEAAKAAAAKAAAEEGPEVIKIPGPICNSDAACKPYCDGTTPQPETAPGMIKPSELVPIPKSTGLSGSGKMRKSAVAALIAAGQKANDWPGGPYTIAIHETYRTLAKQFTLACNALGTGGLGNNIAPPGGSIHGTGLAADLVLWKGSDRLTTNSFSVSRQTKETTQENAKILQDIMASVGWVRYCHEVWHFEWGTDNLPDARFKATRSKNCPWPPP